MTPLFEEVQRPPAWVIALLVASSVAGVASAAVRLESAGPRWTLVAAPAVLVVAALIRMRTVVTPAHVQVTIVPFPRRRIVIGDIARCEVVSYRPLWDYGGWGWRWNRKLGWAYTMRGNRGVTIHRHRGKGFLIGSRRPEELAAAIESVLPATPDPPSGA